MRICDGNTLFELKPVSASPDCNHLECGGLDCYDTITFDIETFIPEENEQFTTVKSEWLGILTEIMKVAAGAEEVCVLETGDIGPGKKENLEMNLIATRVADNVHIALELYRVPFYGSRSKSISVCQEFDRKEAVKMLCREMESYDEIICNDCNQRLEKQHSEKDENSTETGR